MTKPYCKPPTPINQDEIVEPEVWQKKRKNTRKKKSPEKVYKVTTDAVPRCQICGGTDYTLFKDWPDSKYCSKCGLRMSIPNYEYANDLWKAVAHINYIISSMEINGVNVLLEPSPGNPVRVDNTADRLLHNVDKILVDVFNAFNNLFNDGFLVKEGDYHARAKQMEEYIRKLREEAEEEAEKERQKNKVVYLDQYRVPENKAVEVSNGN